MTRILFVCHGNICRSPMAEFLMKELVRQNGASDRFFIASAAVSDEEAGSPIYPPVKKLLDARGISCTEKRAAPLTRADYDRYDYIVGMDEQNLRGMSRLFSGDPAGKLSLLLDHTPHPHAIADPWYTRDFQTAETEIQAGCEALFRHITAQASSAR